MKNQRLHIQATILDTGILNVVQWKPEQRVEMFSLYLKKQFFKWQRTVKTRSHFPFKDHSAVPSVLLLLYLQNSAPYCLHCAWLYVVIWSRPPVFLPSPKSSCSRPPPPRCNAQVSKTRRLLSSFRQGTWCYFFFHIHRYKGWPVWGNTAAACCLRSGTLDVRKRTDCRASFGTVSARLRESKAQWPTFWAASVCMCVCGRACARFLVSMSVRVCPGTVYVRVYMHLPRKMFPPSPVFGNILCFVFVSVCLKKTAFGLNFSPQLSFVSFFLSHTAFVVQRLYFRDYFVFNVSCCVTAPGSAAVSCFYCCFFFVLLFRRHRNALPARIGVGLVTGRNRGQLEELNLLNGQFFGDQLS